MDDFESDWETMMNGGFTLDEIANNQDLSAIADANALADVYNADLDYSNEGRNYPNTESSQGPGGSPVNSSIDDPESNYSNEGRNYPTTGSTQGSGGSPVNSSVTAPSSELTTLLKKLFLNSDGSINKTMAGLTGGGLLGLLGALTKSAPTPTGYQGKIPKYTATRQAPGPGQRLSGNVLFKREDGTVVNPNSAAPATAVGLPAAFAGAQSTSPNGYTPYQADKSASLKDAFETMRGMAPAVPRSSPGAGTPTGPKMVKGVDPEDAYKARLLEQKSGQPSPSYRSETLPDGTVIGGRGLEDMPIMRPDTPALTEAEINQGKAELANKAAANPTFGQDREAAMRQVVAGLPAIAHTAPPSPVIPPEVPRSSPDWIGVDYFEWEDGGPAYNENPIDALHKDKAANAVGADYKTTAADIANSQSQVDAAKAAAAQYQGNAMAKGGALQSGGFVIPADVVSHFGNGSSDAGLKLLAAKLGATPIRGKGDGMSDSIPTTIDGAQKALVAHEEAYLSPDKVARVGGGDATKGAQKLRDMMARIRKARTGSTEQGKQINPGKFMPGGSVQRYEGGGVTGSAINAGVTGTESSLSNWAGDYVTDMLGKGQALSEMPYEQYQGPLTAGPSALQQQVFTGLQNTAFPTNLGQTFTGATAQQYMNPYLSAVLNPQLEEQRRQAQINNLQGLGSFTKSGAFGGGRQAIMESENARNLMQEQNKTIGQAYANAYDKGMQQFNTEQGQARTLVDLLAQQGATQRGIESDAVAADKAQFEEARLNPYKMVQFQQSLLSGLPVQAQQYNVQQPSTLQQILAGAGGGAGLLKDVDLTELTTALKNLNVI